jgi:hypothetical protein
MKGFVFYNELDCRRLSNALTAFALPPIIDEVVSKGMQT